MEIREAIAKIIWCEGGSDTGWETSHSFVHKNGLPYEIADQILSLRIDDCRPAMVKYCEMPCMFDGKGKEKGAIQYRREMGVNIVQEVLDEQTNIRR